MPDGVDYKQTTVDMLRALADVPTFKDVLVTTPDEIARRGTMVGTVLKPALEEGLTVYERG